jgi:hypothetical protein
MQTKKNHLNFPNEIQGKYILASLALDFYLEGLIVLGLFKL